MSFTSQAERSRQGGTDAGKGGQLDEMATSEVHDGAETRGVRTVTLPADAPKREVGHTGVERKRAAGYVVRSRRVFPGSQRPST